MIVRDSDRYLLLTTLLLVLFPLVLSAQSQTERRWSVTLAGFKEIPPVTTPASGTAALRLKGDSLIVSGQFKDLNSHFTGAQIFYGAGEPMGNALLRLKVRISPDGRSGRIHAHENRFRLKPAQKRYLRNGKLFIAITSKDEPFGEIRAPIR